METPAFFFYADFRVGLKNVSHLQQCEFSDSTWSSHSPIATVLEVPYLLFLLVLGALCSGPYAVGEKFE